MSKQTLAFRRLMVQGPFRGAAAQATIAGAEMQVDLGQLGLRDVSLMDGERIDSTLELSNGGVGHAIDGPAAMLLTDKRVIHLQGNGKRRKAAFASIQDIHAVEVGVEREGNSAFVWAGLAFLAALLLYFVSDNSKPWLVAAGGAALMGVYLIVDHLMSAGRPVLVFKAGSYQLRCNLKGDRAPSDLYAFVNRLFELKDRGAADGLVRPSRFAPR